MSVLWNTGEEQGSQGQLFSWHRARRKRPSQTIWNCLKLGVRFMSAHIPLAKSSHMTKLNTRGMGMYTPLILL